MLEHYCNKFAMYFKCLILVDLNNNFAQLKYAWMKWEIKN